MHWKFLCIFYYQPFKRQESRIICDKCIDSIEFIFITNRRKSGDTEALGTICDFVFLLIKRRYKGRHSREFLSVVTTVNILYGTSKARHACWRKKKVREKLFRDKPGRKGTLRDKGGDCVRNTYRLPDTFEASQIKIQIHFVVETRSN